MGILLRFVKKLDMRELVLKFPFLIRFIASCTGLLSEQTINGLVLSLTRSNSFSIAAAQARASSSHGLHFLQESFNLAECILTGSFVLSFIAYNI